MELEKLDANDVNVIVEKGRVFAGLGELKKAAEQFRKAAEAYTSLFEKRQRNKVQVTEEEAPVIVDESPLPKPKFDWYQTPTHVFVSITAKKVQTSELSVTVSDKMVDVAVLNKYRLKIVPFASLDVVNSSHALTEYKIELKLCKLVPGNWPQLEAVPESKAMQVNATPLTKPYSSGKSTKDWSKIEKEAIDPSEEDTSNDPLNALLKKIYKDADEDTRRAMMKSYQTSGGTVLTTNWKEAAEKDFAKEIKPPKGQVYKSWDGKVISKDDDDEEEK